MDFSPTHLQQQELLKELIKLYRTSASQREFESKLGAMTEDKDLVEWATNSFFKSSTPHKSL